MRFAVPRLFLVAALLVAALPAIAQDLPQFPKEGPPGALPEAGCDTTLASDGQWLLGRWVSPQSHWEFARQGGSLVWSLDRRGGVTGDFGWSSGARLEGTVEAVSPCSVRLTAGGGQFVMDGVLSDGGKLFGVAANAQGKTTRFLLRRER